MKKVRFLMSICSAMALLPGVCAQGSDPQARRLLAKAASAFEANKEKMRNWTWTVEEQHVVRTSSSEIQKFPTVLAESLYVGGQRCLSAVRFGDGVVPFDHDRSPEERCKLQAEYHDPFSIDVLLTSTRVRFLSKPPTGPYVLELFPSRESTSRDPQQRCIDSVHAKITLVGSFPQKIEVDQVGEGCTQTHAAVNHYGQSVATKGIIGGTRGSKRTVVYAFQKNDGHPEAACWLQVRASFFAPLPVGGRWVGYAGRQFNLDHPARVGEGAEIRTTQTNFELIATSGFHPELTQSDVRDYSECPAGADLCAAEPKTIRVGSGQYHVVLPANRSARIPNPMNQKVKITNTKGTVCWSLKYPNSVGCNGPQGNSWKEGGETFIVPHQKAGALIYRTENGNTDFSVNGLRENVIKNTAGLSEFKDQQGSFEFDVSYDLDPVGRREDSAYSQTPPRAVRQAPPSSACVAVTDPQWHKFGERQCAHE
jgi:hypothetical protein